MGGKPVLGRGGRSSPSFDPSTREQTATVSLATAAEVDGAIAVVKAAFPAWAARILNRLLRILEERTDELAAVITAEHGKVLSD
ncbi:MAG: aldehyde dehydrogenase family protein, partial [Methylorubrum extorquens]|uniref:aldehyde dehydrogenase family protein n=1 Tax=Methylorubrum extorquens TaxID=408 RepID=UPI002FEE11AD